MLQSEALELLKLGLNVFLTGAAGAGKTYVLNSYIDYLREHQVRVAVTASTGIAATHLSGQTIHSWSGIGVRETLTARDLETIAGHKRIRGVIRGAKVLIIDEVSMLHARVLDAVEAIARTVRGGDEPFGGLQVVLCGDFFQLPPVVKEDFGSSGDEARFAFESRAWSQANFHVCYLHEQHRQKADPLLQVLNDIRSATVTDSTKVPLRSRYRKPPHSLEGKPCEPTILYARNVNVDAVNQRELERLNGESRTYSTESRGFRAHVEALQRNCLAPQSLTLKLGAQVMFVKNDPEGLYVNGTRGVVEAFDPVDGWPEIRTTDGDLIVAEPAEWRFEENGVAQASIFQVPLRLAWAITIHKSQGMTLDAAEVDLSDAFEPGMGYVALSRVRALCGLKLMGLNETAVRVHPGVLAHDGILRERSERSIEMLRGMSDVEKADRSEQTLTTRFGGKHEAGTPLKSAGKRKKEKGGRDKGPATHQVTGHLIEQGCSLEAAAVLREVTVGTVLTHLEKLKGEQRLPPIDHLRAEMTVSEFENVLGEWHRSEDGKLAPIWSRLEGKYSYEVLRMVRLFV